MRLFDHIRDQVFNMDQAMGPEFALAELKELEADVAEAIEDIRNPEEEE